MAGAEAAGYRSPTSVKVCLRERESRQSGLFVSRRELAAACGVAVQAVSNWMSRHQDFPGLVSHDGREGFMLQEMASSLDGRMIPATNARTVSGPESPTVTDSAPGSDCRPPTRQRRTSLERLVGSRPMKSKWSGGQTPLYGGRWRSWGGVSIQPRTGRSGRTAVVASG